MTNSLSGGTRPPVPAFIRLLAMGALVLLQACSSVARPSSQSGDSGPLPKHQDSPASSVESDEDRTVLAVSKAIRSNHLVNLPDKCIAYQFDGRSSKDDFLVEVRENHRDFSCGGDPNTSPRLFSVRVSRKTGDMSADAKSPGKFRPLPR